MRKVAVITGASSGIGLSMAKLLSAKGYGLLLVARREGRLKEIASALGNCEIFVADLSLKKECLRFEQFLESYSFEIFINNAGFGECGSFAQISLERESEMISLNVFALHHLTKTACRILENQGGGRVLNVASSAGLLPGGPYMATYYATKAYVASLSQAVAQELKETKSSVSLSCLCPGPVDTEFNQVANVEFALPGITADFCGNYALKQMFKGKTLIVPGLLMKLSLLAARLLPRSVLVSMAGAQQKKKIPNHSL